MISASNVWVPGTVRSSCDLLVLVDQPAEAVASLDVMDGGCAALRKGSQRSGLAEDAVWPVLIEVARVLPKCSSCVPLIDDQ